MRKFTFCKIKNRKHKDEDNKIKYNVFFEYMWPVCKYCDKTMKDG